MGGSSAWSCLTEYLPWELGSSVGESHMMAAAEARGIWRRTAAKCHMVQEDAIRSPKFCPLPRIVSRSPADTCHSVGYSYYLSNSWGSVDPRMTPEFKVDLQWQFSPGTLRDYRSDLSGLDESPSMRFSKPAGLQSLAADSNTSVKSRPGLMSVGSDYTAAELEFEWQFIVDPLPKSGLAAPRYHTEMCKKDELTFREAVRSATHDGPERIPQVNICEVGSSDKMMRSKNEVRPYGCHSKSGQNKQPALVPKPGALSEQQDMSSISSMERNPSWQVADKEALSGLFAQEIVDCLENCDLPCPQSRLIPKSASTRFDLSPSIEKKGDVSQSSDQNRLPSLGHETEPTRLGNIDLSPSPFILGNLDHVPWPAASLHLQRVSESLTIPSIEAPPTKRGSHTCSINSANSCWSGGAAINMDRGSGLLGEALCRSQTRAREAERKIQRAYEEKEQLMHMFFKEASLALTYRQWVTSLQTENMWLRMSARQEPVAWLQHSIFNPFSALERLSNRRWKDFSLDYLTRCQMDQNISALWHEKNLVYLGHPDDIVMGYTLAFALGLSLAGAGLMLGWSMGWILLAY